MNIVYKSRICLIRFAKVFPFVLCFLVLSSLIETLYALCICDFVLYEGNLTPNTPIAWHIARYYTFGVYSLILAFVFAISFETCIYNKASIGYLAIFLGQQKYFPTIELYPEYIYAIVTFNLLCSGFFVFKGITILFRKNN